MNGCAGLGERLGGAEPGGDGRGAGGGGRRGRGGGGAGRERCCEGRVRQGVAGVLEGDAGAIGEGFGRDDAPAWDSLNHLRLVTALEEAFGIRLTMKEVS